MAKAFAYRLEPLLKMRRRYEDEQKRVVAARLRGITALEQRQQVLEQEIGRQTEVMRSVLSGEEVELEGLRMSRHWMLRLRRGVLETDAAISAERAILAHERQALAEARRNTKVLERLKERKQEVWWAALQRREQAELDEMNTLRFAHAGLAGDHERP